MSRPVTMFTGQWADMPLKELAKKAAAWGYDGLELACWGDHFDAEKGAKYPAYCEQQKAILAENGLKMCVSISFSFHTIVPGPLALGSC